MLKKLVLSAIASIIMFSEHGYSEGTDITDEFVGYVENHLIGQGASGYKRYDYRKNGVGKIVHGNASGRITELVKWDGRGMRYDYEDDIWGEPTTHVRIGADASFTFRYEGSSKGETQCYTPFGSSSCGYEWGSVHPQGRIILDVDADPSAGYRIEVRYEVISDADSRAAEVTRLAMMNLKPKAVDVVQTFVRKYKPDARFVVN